MNVLSELPSLDLFLQMALAKPKSKDAVVPIGFPSYKILKMFVSSSPY